MHIPMLNCHTRKYAVMAKKLMDAVKGAVMEAISQLQKQIALLYLALIRLLLEQHIQFTALHLKLRRAIRMIPFLPELSQNSCMGPSQYLELPRQILIPFQRCEN